MNDVANWLNPRLRLNLERMVEFVWMQNSKMRMTQDMYARLREQIGLDRYAVDQAVNDGYKLGVFDTRVSGDTFAVVLLSLDVDRCTGGDNSPGQARRPDVLSRT